MTAAHRPRLATADDQRCGIVQLDPSEAYLRALSLPDSSDPSQSPFAIADAAARQAAIGALEAAFPGLPLGRATQATDATTLAVGSASPDMLAALDGEGFLERAFQRFALRPEANVKLVRDKEHRRLDEISVVEPLAHAAGLNRARMAGLATALDEGFTVVLDGIDLRAAALVVLAGLFERAFGCHVNINGYISARRHTSFGAHWDDQEVVILQLVGRKDWTIEAPAALSMNRLAHGAEVTGQVMWQGRIGLGDAVYVPRGWGHLVSGIDELSYHLTITIPRINGLQMLEGVLTEMVADQDLSAPGRPLPLLPGADPIEPLPLDPANVDRAVRRALARSRFNIPRRSIASLRAPVKALDGRPLDDVFVRCPASAGWTVVDTSELGTPEQSMPSGALIMGLAGQLVAIPRHHSATVATLCDGRVHGATSGEPEVVRALVRAGILDVVTDADAWGLIRA